MIKCKTGAPKVCTLFFLKTKGGLTLFSDFLTKFSP